MARSTANIGCARTEPSVSDSAATRVFQEQHQPLLQLAFLLSGNRSLAEDSVAEVFARSWSGLVKGKIDHPGAYLRRALVNELRRQGRRRTIERLLARESPNESPSFESAFDTRDQLLRALRELPPRQRAVLILRYWEDRPVSDTAAILNISDGSVKTHVHRGLTHLRHYLDGIDDY